MRSALLCASSAEGLFLFVVSKRLRAFRNYFFTGGVVTKNGSRRARFLRKQSRGMADFCGSVSTFVQRRLGERGFCPQCRRFRRKRALQMQFALVTPSVKMRLERSAERDKREI